MMKTPQQPVSKPKSARKRQYKRPQVTEFGSVGELTRGGSSGLQPDGGGTMRQ